MSLEDIEAAVKRDLAQGQRRARVSAILYPTVTAILCIALWQGISWGFRIPTFLLPGPNLVIQSLFQNSSVLIRESGITTLEIVLGYLMSILVGIPLALAIFLWPPFGRSVYPLLVSSQAMPKVAVAPLLIVWFGFGLLPKVLIAFLIAFFPIVINTAMGLAAIEQEKLYLAQSMGLSGTETFFKIRLPNALPSLFAGLKISITLAVVGAVVGEFVGGNAGLGYQLMVANGSMDTPLLFAGLTALTILGIVLFLVVELAEYLMIPHRSDRASFVAQGSL